MSMTAPTLRIATANIAALDVKIEHFDSPYAVVAEKPDEVTGVGQRSAQEIIAELGVTAAAGALIYGVSMDDFLASPHLSLIMTDEIGLPLVLSGA